MSKKIIVCAAILSQLLFSCSKDEEPTPVVAVVDTSLNGQVAAIMQLPYSALTPAQQKVKLEADANASLTEMDKISTSNGIDALENLNTLLSINNEIEFLDQTKANKVQDLINSSGVYGIHTWDNSKQIWVKTPSTTDLKFIFPGKKGQTTNNAIISIKSVSSDVKIKTDESDPQSDEMYLPSSAEVSLSVDNILAASISTTAKYSGGKKEPDSATYKITLSNGYVWENTGTKTPDATFISSFSHNGKNILEFNSGGTTKIDDLLKDDGKTNEYLGKANFLVKILDNFILVGDANLEQYAKDSDDFYAAHSRPKYNTSTYYTDLNTYNKAISEAQIASFSKNYKIVLVSKADGTKIADLVRRSEKGRSSISHSKWVVNTQYPNGGYWSYDEKVSTTVQEYDEVQYLRFKDNTEVEFSAYFSTGFEKLQTKFEDFVKGFERK